MDLAMPRAKALGGGAAARNAIGRMRDRSGQATVELALALPVAVAIAVMLVNALLFFSECAAFDRAFRGAVRVHATSPAYGQDAGASCALIAQELERAFSDEGLAVEVAASGGGAGHTTFTATLSFAPTLFGRGPVESVFGVSLPRLAHTVTMTIDQYKPGVIA